ncbi:hypothetical protein P2G88_19005 [Aliiglaciecola sp. CAU 1673]|uniref:hypothetical protein n=1 Tax=Aliiglaciecola sp. CAU 1673 TaxID=3032595 RepID=UPI0023DAF1B2|nr:hypothetical protein [Aliiglaciecola sp. CAU 1673]MDF2180352.1 hypothetical protein [Aliiglaciecola sp. CAU 1673]
MMNKYTLVLAGVLFSSLKLAEANPHSSEQDALHVTLSLAGSGTEHLQNGQPDWQCSGGDWQYRWSGKVQGETNNAERLYNGDGMFYNEADARSGQASLSASALTCQSKLDQQWTEVQRGQLQADIPRMAEVQASFANGNPFFSFQAGQLATCSVQSEFFPSMELPVALGLSTGQGTLQLSPAFQVSLEELQQGFNKTWRLRADQTLFSGYACAGQQIEGTLQLRFKQAETLSVKMAQCTDLALGQQIQAVAQGEPDGGSYEFNSTLGKGLSFSPQKSRDGKTTVTGSEPGRGNLRVTYQLDGERAEWSQPATVVSLQSVAQTELELGLIDAQGKPEAPTNVAFSTLPANAGDLLKWQVADSTLLSLAPGSNNLTLQGVKPGKTKVEAHTLCDESLNRSIDVTIRMCRLETEATLERRRERLKDRNNAISQQVQELLNDEEFERVDKEIKDDTINLAIKAGESIIGTLSLAQQQKLKVMQQNLAQGTVSEQTFRTVESLAQRQEAIELGTKVYEYYDTAMDVMEGYEAARELYHDRTSREEAYDSIAKGSLAALAFVSPEAAGLGKSYAEAIMAAEKMGQNLGTMWGVSERIEDLLVQFRQVEIEWENTARLLKRCRSVNPQDSDAAPADASPSKPASAKYLIKQQQQNVQQMTALLKSEQAEMHKVDQLKDDIAALFNMPEEQALATIPEVKERLQTSLLNMVELSDRRVDLLSRLLGTNEQLEPVWASLKVEGLDTLH